MPLLVYRAFPAPPAVRRGVLVWDTSALSQAFEEFGHAVVSAFTSGKRPPGSWPEFRARILRRVKSAAVGRRLLMDCDRATCLVSPGIVREARRVGLYGPLLDALLGDPLSLAVFYAKRTDKKYDPQELASLFAPRLIVERPPEAYFNRAMEAAEVELGMRVCYGRNCDLTPEDVEAVALAMARGATLVSGDWNQVKLARYLGVPTIYTLEKGKEDRI